MASTLGESIPPNTAHAVSVSLPTWKANVGYEEGQEWVVGRMVTGYPRFFIHKSIEALAENIVARYGQQGQRAMLFPTRKTARRCVEFMREKAAPELLAGMAVVDLALDPQKNAPPVLQSIRPSVSAVLYRADAQPIAKQYWQHSGDGISSRRAEFCYGLFKENLLVCNSAAASPPRVSQQKVHRGPRRYQRPASVTDVPEASNGEAASPVSAAKENGSTDREIAEALESSRFLEERYGRNLDLSLVENAKSAIRRRIAGVLTGDVDLEASLPAMDSDARGVSNLREDDIYLAPCGMNAIFTAHQALLRHSAPNPLRSVEFGFPYVDTLKILEKFGPGAIFYGHGSPEDLEALEARLSGGERIMALFTEFPGNPLLTCPDLQRIRVLADKYDFAVVVDETVGTFANVNVLPYADIVVSSLTKIFSGDSNVMGGSLVLNPGSRYYAGLKAALSGEDGCFEDTYWAEDAIFMERNSRDFRSRIDRVNANAEIVCDVLRAHPLVRNVFYPKHNPSRANFEACRLPGGGYGGLLSVTLSSRAQAAAFYDALQTHKGPSLGTNFTLTSPYVILAHYAELDWAESFGVSRDLVRVSVGLEENLESVFTQALKAAEAAPTDDEAAA